MVHSAFDDVCVISDSPAKIDSAICSEDSVVYVGCSDGSLRIYAPREPDSAESVGESSSAELKRYVLRKTVVGFAKKAVQQMDLVKSRGGMLISLAESIAVHTIPGLEPVDVLEKSKGAALFCWDEQRGLLCVAKHKRLHIYRHDGSRAFTEVKELTAPDVVKSMAWSGDSVCVGVKREYIFINVTTGATSDLFPCGRVAPPIVVSLPRGELLLGKDNIGVFVDQNGKVTQQGALSWSESPSAVMVHPPYVLARLSRFIEVRPLREPYGLVQMISHKGMRLLQSSGFGLLAASENSVYKLIPVAIAVQVVQLAASGNFDDALTLCKLMPPEDAALRTSKEEAIHIRYGQFLFRQGQYGEALQHFALSTLSLSSIIALFSSIKLPKFCTDNDTEDLEFGDTEVSEQDKPVSNTIALSALATFLMNKRGDTVDRAEAQETNEAVAAIVETSVGRKSHKHETEKQEDDPRRMACVLDTALVQALLLSNQSSMAIQLLKGSNYCDIEACEDFMINGGYYKELVELYRYKAMHQKALQLLVRLLESPESFPVSPPATQFGPEAIVDYLQSLGGQDPHLILEFSTLVLKHSPDHAMKLFTSTNPPLPAGIVLSKLKNHAPELQIVYLEEMVNHSPDSLSAEVQSELILLYLSQALEERARSGSSDDQSYQPEKSKLLKALETFTCYRPQDVYRRLPKDGLHEERAVLLGRMRQHQLALSIYVHELHDPEKALNYCDRVFEAARTTGNRTLLTLPADQEGANVYLTLLEIYLRPKSSFKELKLSTGFGLKSRVNKAGKAKGHIARKITQIEEAQSYTNGNESAAESSRSDTEESVDGNVMLDEAIDLLSCRWKCFDGAQVLQLLPSDVKLKDLIPFLEPVLRRSIERRRKAAVISRVQYRHNLQTRYELQDCRKSKFKVTSETACFVCHKKIGPSVVAVYPMGAFAHFVCYSEQHGRRVFGS